MATRTTMPDKRFGAPRDPILSAQQNFRKILAPSAIPEKRTAGTTLCRVNKQHVQAKGRVNKQQIGRVTRVSRARGVGGQ